MKIIENSIKEREIEIIKKYLNHVNLNEINEDIRKQLENKKLIELYDNNNSVITVALISKPNRDYYTNLFKIFMYPDAEDSWYDEVYDEGNYEQLYYLDCIKSIQPSIGGAKYVVDYIFNKYGSFWLYAADEESEEFWQHLELDYIGDYIYIKK